MRKACQSPRRRPKFVIQVPELVFCMGDKGSEVRVTTENVGTVIDTQGLYSRTL